MKASENFNDDSSKGIITFVLFARTNDLLAKEVALVKLYGAAPTS